MFRMDFLLYINDIKKNWTFVKLIVSLQIQ